MKYYFILFCLQLLFVPLGIAQVTENFNGGTSCGNSTCFNGSINPSCLPNWGASHGTPNVIDNSFGTFNIPTDGNALQIFNSGNGNEEGAFLNLGRNSFVDGQCYRITFDLSTNGNTNGTSFFKLFAVSGLTQTNVANCESSLPTFMGEDISEDMISIPSFASNDFFQSNSSWANIEIIYSATEDNSQLFFFIDYQSVNGQSVVAIDNLVVEEVCSSFKVFNIPVVGIPSGTHTYDNYIQTGSNSGTINSATNASTTLEAGNYILFEPTTCITAPTNPNGMFLAHIVPCEDFEECTAGGKVVSTGGSGTRSAVTGTSSTLTTIEQEPSGYRIIERTSLNASDDFGVSLEQVNIYPNPARDIIFIDNQSIADDFINVEILSSDGQLLLQQTQVKAGDKKELMIAHYPKGIYMVKINDRFHSKVVKLVVN